VTCPEEMLRVGYYDLQIKRARQTQQDYIGNIAKKSRRNAAMCRAMALDESKDISKKHSTNLR